MRLFRAYFNVGWCSMDVQAEDRKEAIRKVWEALDKLSHGAVAGLRLGSYTVSAQHIRELGDGEDCGLELPAQTHAPGCRGARDDRERPHGSKA